MPRSYGQVSDRNVNDFLARMNNDTPLRKLLSCAAMLLLAACQQFPKPPIETGYLICHDVSHLQGQAVGDGHCVSLIKRCSQAPLSSEWRPGKLVQDSKLPSGTVIATFRGNHYPSTSGYHAAIYIEQDEQGIWVWDQWQGMPVHKRLIRWRNPGATPANTGTAYRVVSTR